MVIIDLTYNSKPICHSEERELSKIINTQTAIKMVAVLHVKPFWISLLFWQSKGLLHLKPNFVILTKEESPQIDRHNICKTTLYLDFQGKRIRHKIQGIGA
jgi:hypothetical protein